MKLYDFINHLKHNSIIVKLFIASGKDVYKGSVGELKHWYWYSLYINHTIHNINCENNELWIHLNEVINND